MHHAYEPDGLPYAVDYVRFEGTQMSLTGKLVRGVISCEDIVGIYEVRMLEGDRIRVKTIEDDCKPRKRETNTVFYWVPPTPTPAAPALTPTPFFTLANSAEQIAGTYQKTMGAGCIRFQGDGTLRQARRVDALDDSSFAICEIRFEGTQMQVGECTVSGVPPCNVHAVYEVRLLEGGGIEVVAIEDDCGPRRLDTAALYDAVD
jgi:hypothetical protein